MELEQLYKEGGPFPDYLDREFVILLEASSRGAEHSADPAGQPGQAGTSPVPHRYTGQPPGTLQVADSTLPDEVIRSIPAERLSINGLNRLCQAVERIAPEDLKLWYNCWPTRITPARGHPWAGYPCEPRGENIQKKSLSGRSMNWFPGRTPSPPSTVPL